ncbi:MAG: hypothetical protein LQ349_006524, partial [Xanthoria aureola]
MSPKKKNVKKGTPKKGAPKKGISKKEEPKQTPKKETPEQTPRPTPKEETPKIENPKKDIPKVQTPIIETTNNDTLQKATPTKNIHKGIPDGIKSVCKTLLNPGSYKEMYRNAVVPREETPTKKTPTKETPKNTSKNELPKKGTFRTGCYSCAEKETSKPASRNGSREDEPPRKEPPTNEPPKNRPPKVEPRKQETMTSYERAFAMLDESIANQQRIWASLNPITDLNTVHPLQKTMMRVFFEALCIRLGKVEELKRRISDCKEDAEYYAFPDLFDDVSFHENTWTLRTGLSMRYTHFLNDILFLPDACKDLIQKVSKNKFPQDATSWEETRDEKNGKGVTFDKNTEKEKVEGKQDASAPSARTRSSHDVWQKKPLRDRTNKDASRINNAEKDTPHKNQKVAKNEKANEHIVQKHPRDKATHGKHKETQSDKINKGSPRVDNANREALKRKQKASKDEKASEDIGQKEAPPPKKQKASQNENTNQPISLQDPSQGPDNTHTIHELTHEEKLAWGKLIRYPADPPLIPMNRPFGLVRLEKISTRLHNIELARGNVYGEEIMESPDYLAPHTAFQVIDGDPHTIHGDAIALAKILIAHRHDEAVGFWKTNYFWFDEIYPYVYGGWCGAGKTVEEVAGMDDAVELGRWFPKGMDAPVFGRGVEVAEWEGEWVRERKRGRGREGKGKGDIEGDGEGEGGG